MGAAGVAWRLSDVPTTPVPSLAQRLEHLRDVRVVLTLLTTCLAFAGLYLVYTYVGLSFEGATQGSPRVLAALLLLWGAESLSKGVLPRCR